MIGGTNGGTKKTSHKEIKEKWRWRDVSTNGGTKEKIESKVTPMKMWYQGKDGTVIRIFLGVGEKRISAKNFLEIY